MYNMFIENSASALGFLQATAQRVELQPDSTAGVNVTVTADCGKWVSSIQGWKVYSQQTNGLHIWLNEGALLRMKTEGMPYTQTHTCTCTHTHAHTHMCTCTHMHSHALLQDYPSVGQISAKLRENDIIPIFAVTQLSTYQVTPAALHIQVCNTMWHTSLF